MNVSAIMGYLIVNPLVAVFLCLGCGYLAGNLKIRSFSFGATVSTLVVGIVLSLAAKPYGGFQIDKTLQNCFFAMFSFTLGYDVGPAFFRAIRSSGARSVALAVFHALCAGGFIWLACLVLGLNKDEGLGLLSGAFTITAAKGADPASVTDLVYALNYSFGVISIIVFVRFLAPKLLGAHLLHETKRHLDALGAKKDEPAEEAPNIIQVRAFAVADHGPYSGRTVESVEQEYDYQLEIEAIYRGGERIQGRQSEIIAGGDVLVTVGNIASLNHFDNAGLTEVTEARYFEIKRCAAQIVLAIGADEEIHNRLTNYGIVVRSVTRGGHTLRRIRETDLREGDILEVYGPEGAISEVSEALGYLKDDGVSSDIPFFALAVAAGLVIASASLTLWGKKIELGVSLGTLLLGLICGWWYDRKPRFGYLAGSTRWFIKSFGLNLYIAVAGLASRLTVSELMSWRSLMYVGVGLALTILVRMVTLLLGKYVLKMNAVDLLGGVCGAAASTPALNSLTEYTGSSVFAVSYAPAYAVGNVMLILTGILLTNIIP